MRLLILTLFISLFTSTAAAQAKTITAPNGQTIRVDGSNGFRGTDEIWMYTAQYYAQRPTNESGVDVYVVDNKVVAIQDRAGAVFLQGKADPGPLRVGTTGYVLSGNGSGRRWLVANLKVGDGVGTDGKPLIFASSPYSYPGFGLVQAANGKTVYLRGKNAPRSQDFVVALTPDFYKSAPPNDAGVDVLVVKGKVVQINDRAGAVYLEKTKDPGPITVTETADAVVISGNGEGRKWLVDNMKVGDAVSVNLGDPSKEVVPLAVSPCFAGAHYRKYVSSYDAWTGIGGVVKLGTPKVDENRLDEKDKLPLDNFSVYMGGNAGGKFEVDAGLTWEFTIDENGKKSDRRNAFRPFWRTQKPGDWNNAPARKEFYFYPGETVQMAILAAGPGKLRLVITDGKAKTFQTDFDAEGFVAGVPRQFKRVNAIDQRFNEGKPTQATKAEVTGAEWLQTLLLRGEGASTQQLPMGPARATDMRCSNGTVVVTPTAAANGGEKIDIYGFPKN
jgi:hypothetical protein